MSQNRINLLFWTIQIDAIFDFLFPIFSCIKIMSPILKSYRYKNQVLSKFWQHFSASTILKTFFRYLTNNKNFHSLQLFVYLRKNVTRYFTHHHLKEEYSRQDFLSYTSSKCFYSCGLGGIPTSQQRYIVFSF